MADKTLTIIDSDNNVASLVEQGFGAFGFITHVIGEGDPIEFVRSHGPQLILLNVELPGGGSGFALCNRLKRQQDLSGIPIILTSQESTPEAFQQHSKTPTPADAYLLKSQAGSIEQLVQLLLERARQLLPDAFQRGGAASNGAIQTEDDFNRALQAELSSELELRDEDFGHVSSEGEPVSSMSAEGGPPPLPKSGGPPPLRKKKAPPKGQNRASLKELLDQARGDEPPPPKVAGRGLEEKVASLRESLKRKEQDLARANDLWAEREREAAQLEDDFQIQERELERAKKAREDLLSQLTQTEDTVAALRADTEISAERSDRLEREKKALSHELEETQDELERTTQALTGQLGDLQNALAAEQQARAEEGAAAQQEITELRGDLEAARAEFAEKSQAWARAEQQMAGRISDLEAHLTESQGAGQRLSEEKDRLTMEGSELREQLAQIKQERADENAQASSTIEDLTTRLNDLQADKESVEADLEQTQAQRDTERGLRKEAEDRITDLESDLANAEGRSSELSMSLQEAETRADELSLELEDTQASALELAQEKQRVDGSLAERTRELESTEATLNATRAELAEERARAANDREDFETQLAQLNADVASRDEELSMAADERARLESAIADRNDRLADYESALSAEREGRAQDIETRDTAIAGLEDTIANLRDDAREAEKAAKHREADLSAELDSVRANADELDAGLARTRAKLAEVESQLGEGREKISELTGALHRAESAIKEMSEQLQDARERGDELEALLSDQREQRSIVEAELDNEKKTHEEDVQKYSAALEKLKAQSKARIGDLEAERDSFSSQLAETENELAVARDELETLGAEHEATGDRLESESAQRKELEDRLAHLDDVLETTQGSAEALKDENQRIKQLLDKAQAERDQLKKQSAEREDKFRDEEATLIKDLESIKKSKMDDESRLGGELESLRVERDTVKEQFNELKRKAQAIKKRLDDTTANVEQREGALTDQLEKLKAALHEEKQARAADKNASAGAVDEMKARLRELEDKLAGAADEDELVTLRANLKEKEQRVVKLNTDLLDMKERAKKAIGKAKQLDEQLKAAEANAGGGEADEELKTKYAEAVRRFKESQEKLKASAERQEEITGKYRKLMAAYKKLKDG